MGDLDDCACREHLLRGHLISRHGRYKATCVLISLLNPMIERTPRLLIKTPHNAQNPRSLVTISLHRKQTLIYLSSSGRKKSIPHRPLHSAKHCYFVDTAKGVERKRPSAGGIISICYALRGFNRSIVQAVDPLVSKASALNRTHGLLLANSSRASWVQVQGKAPQNCD